MIFTISIIDYGLHQPITILNRSFIFSKILSITLYMAIGEQVMNLKNTSRSPGKILHFFKYFSPTIVSIQTGRNQIPVKALVSIALYFDVSLDYFVERTLLWNSIKKRIFRKKKYNFLADLIRE